MALDSLLPAILSGLACGLVTWGGMRREIEYLKRHIEAAHWRLDRVNAPPAPLRMD